ncbi:MAG: hypothetical protein AAGF11_34930 [Myxococcota bacterium]
MWAAARVLARMGAQVEIAQDGENLVRKLDPADWCDPAQNRADRPQAQVVAQGLPNLLHELVHAVQAGCLDDDWGIDYGAIPFDLNTAAGRAMLWEELACCTISCAYLWAHGHAARAGAPEPVVRAEIGAWFDEQVGILPVFFGMEDAPAGFVGRVGGLLQTRADEATEVLARAYAATERALGDAGASATWGAAPRRPSMSTLWRDLRPSGSGGSLSMERA